MSSNNSGSGSFGSSTNDPSSSQSLPSQAEFMEHHLHECEGPANTRCSICLEGLDNGEAVVRIDLNHEDSACHFHKACISRWFDDVGFRRWACLNDRIELFDTEPVDVNSAQHY